MLVVFWEALEEKNQSLIFCDSYTPFGGTFNSYTSGTENLYKFTGMEEQKETQLYDFNARMYDPWLGRFNSVDPHADFYESVTPYNYAFNNPLLFVDPTGMDNTIYLIVAGDYDRDQAQKVVDQANAAFEELGVETRVSLYDSEANGDFDAANLDDTDNWAVIGTDREAIVETATNINPEWGEYLEDGSKPWSGGNNPETSNNDRHGDGRGIVIDHSNNLNKGANKLSKEEGSGLSIVHGAGHSAKRIINNKSASGEYGHTDSGIMQGGNGLVRDLNSNGKSSVLNPGKNQTYIEAIKERYGTNKSTDNYSKNKGGR